MMRIAIVNDLALARAVLRRVVESVPGYEVAWVAADGAAAVRLAAANRPDVILMDLVMPVMDGVEATRHIMQHTPCPILVVTASVGSNFDRVFEALGAGGLDAVRTPTLGPGGHVVGGEPLLERLNKLQRAAEGRIAPAPRAVPGERGAREQPAPPSPGLGMIALGASTGGPTALAQILVKIRQPCPGPIVVVQHIGADFSQRFTQWLGAQTGLQVASATAGQTPAGGHVYVATGDNHLVVQASGHFAYQAEPRLCPYRPSVDVFFRSLAAHWPARGVAVLLTGMGSDGAEGLAALRAAGWHTIAQDAATSVVYGMPRAAAELQAATQVLPLPEIAAAINHRIGSA